ncbi:hypothetical protein, partial [Komagataeibacter intermedius]|uniref:hypothetical protein n=1 Tax=Komagataeibacter intermedius TaxID=66229 RepID=UPI001ADFEF02
QRRMVVMGCNNGKPDSSLSAHQKRSDAELITPDNAFHPAWSGSRFCQRNRTLPDHIIGHQKQTG